VLRATPARQLFQVAAQSCAGHCARNMRDTPLPARWQPKPIAHTKQFATIPNLRMRHLRNYRSGTFDNYIDLLLSLK
jgi:hypothetical protein